MHKYEKIKQELLYELKNYVFAPGDKFYSESDIKKKYNVSSITAVKALNELTTAGYLYRIQGKGTFVSKAKISQIVRFSDIENHIPQSETVSVLSLEEECNPKIQQVLGLFPHESYIKITRIRYVDQTPFIIHVTHLPQKLVKQPIAKDLSAYNSIYQRIREDFHIDLFAADSQETNEIVFLSDQKLQSLLHLSANDPVVKQVKTSYLPDQTVAEYIISYKHWKFFKTKIEVSAR